MITFIIHNIDNTLNSLKNHKEFIVWINNMKEN